MLKPEFRDLERALLAADVAPRFVWRTIQELSDHFEDLRADAIQSGYRGREAGIVARRAMGSDTAILAAVTSRTELMRWPSRWPRCAALLDRACYYGLLPVVPFVYCTQHGSTIARWTASIGLATLVTGAMLFSMQLAIR
jgi:hypothetical protein